MVPTCKSILTLSFYPTLCLKSETLLTPLWTFWALQTSQNPREYLGGAGHLQPSQRTYWVAPGKPCPWRGQRRTPRAAKSHGPTQWAWECSSASAMAFSSSQHLQGHPKGWPEGGLSCEQGRAGCSSSSAWHMRGGVAKAVEPLLLPDGLVEKEATALQVLPDTEGGGWEGRTWVASNPLVA